MNFKNSMVRVFHFEMKIKIMTNVFKNDQNGNFQQMEIIHQNSNFGCQKTKCKILTIDAF